MNRLCIPIGRTLAAMALVSLFTPVYSQKAPSTAQIDSILKNIRRMTDSFAHTPKLQKMLSQGKTINTDSLTRMAKSRTGGNPMAGSTLTPGGMRPDTTSGKLPPKNTAALGGIPSKALTSAGIRSYVTDLDKRLAPALHKSYGTPLVNTDKYDAGTLTNASVLAASMGLTDQAVLLALKAAEREPDDPAILNNTGAVLQCGGANVAAILLLESALEKDPANSTVNNNLGQAYLALGDRDKARQYFQQCTSRTPLHPLANTSLALIDLDKGDRSSALQHAENSLRGAFTDKGYHLLYKLKKDPILMDYFKQRYKQPEYFDEQKYVLPLQCEQVADIPRLEAEYKAYHDMLDHVRHSFDQEAVAESKLGTEAMLQRVKHFQPGSYIGAVQPPFMELAAAMLLDLKMRMDRSDGDEIARSQQRYKQHMQQLQTEYDQLSRQHLECGARIALANSYMEKMSVETHLYQKTYLRVYKDFFLDNAYWSFFTFFDQHQRRAAFCRLASSFVSVLQQVAITHFLSVSLDCATDDQQTKHADSIQILGDCPFGGIAGAGYEIPLVIGKYTVSCDKQEIEFGELIVVNLSHNFNTGETILAIGPGASVSLIGHTHESLKQIPQLQLGPLRTGVEAGIKGQLFFDWKNGSLMDWGGTFSAELDFLGLANELKTGYTLGMNNGLQMENGFLKDLIDDNLGPPKEAPQINKNVKKYNP